MLLRSDLDGSSFLIQAELEQERETLRLRGAVEDFFPQAEDLCASLEASMSGLV